MSNQEEGKVGYKNPPRATRFSHENQPKRRRRGRRSEFGGGFQAIMLEALSEQISLSKNGKPVKADVMLALVKKYVQQAFSGSLDEQTRFFRFLESIGLLDALQLKQELEEQRRECEADYQDRSKQLHELTRRSFENCAERVALFSEFFNMTWALLGLVRTECTCGLFEGEFGEEYDRLVAGIEADDANEERKMDELEAKYPASAAGGYNDQWSSPARPPPPPPSCDEPTDPCERQHRPDEDPDDEFYSGMLGRE